MEILVKFKDYFFGILDKGSLGLSLTEYIVIFLSFSISVFIRSIFAKLIVSKIKNAVKKTGNKIDDQLFDSLASPLKILPIIFVFIFISLYINVDTRLSLYFEKINRTLITIFMFWFMHQSLVPLSQAFQKLETLFSKALVIWLTKSLKYLIIFLGIVAVLETWGIKIGPVIAGLGLLGVAVALGAQDLFKNLISGILIILEKRFQINDTIEVPGQTMGNVEHIGFRSTVIRQFDSTPISIPNYVFSDSSIINYSERKYRRIKWIIGVTYDTSTDQLKKICQDIEEFLKTNNNFCDVECGYKAFKSNILKRVNLKEKSFGFEIELLIKVAKMKVKIFEVAVSYNARKYSEGKKIKFIDALRAFYCLIKY